MRNIVLDGRPLRRRSLLHSLAAAAAASLLIACGQEPSGTMEATNASPTPAPTRIVLIPTPLPTATPPPLPTATPPSPVEFIRSIERPGMIPCANAVDRQGNIFIADNANHQVHRFTTAGQWLLAWGSHGTGDGEFSFMYVGPNASLAVDPQGILYVGDATQRVQKFDGNGRFLGKWGSKGTGDGEFAQWTQVAVDAQGTVYVADPPNDRVQVFDGTGKFVRKWGSRGGGDGEFNQPNGVAFGRLGEVYVVDRLNYRVQLFDGMGTFVRKWGRQGTGKGEFDRPVTATVDAAEDVYVIDNYNHRVQKFDASGKYLGQWGRQGSAAGEFRYPQDASVDQQGLIYVTDWGNNRVQVFRWK